MKVVVFAERRANDQVRRRGIQEHAPNQAGL